jgi:hypothetical protein
MHVVHFGNDAPLVTYDGLKHCFCGLVVWRSAAIRESANTAECYSVRWLELHNYPDAPVVTPEEFSINIRDVTCIPCLCRLMKGSR